MCGENVQRIRVLVGSVSDWSSVARPFAAVLPSRLFLALDRDAVLCGSRKRGATIRNSNHAKR